MRKELDDKLCKRFPVLYQDRRAPMTQTCMCWGFDHGDGWFDIIWQLSLALEDELGYSWLQERTFLLKKALVRRWNDLIYRLSPVVRDEMKWVPGKGMEVVKKGEPTWDEKFVRVVFGPTEKISANVTVPRLGLKRLAITRVNTGFAVEQVKEKFGTLRFYCPGNDRIWNLVRMAERLSAVTCEKCGEYGKVRGGGWTRTLCNKHAGVEGDDDES